MEKLEGPYPMDFMDAIEELDASAISPPQLVVKTSNLSIFVSDPLIQSNTVSVASLDHERSGKDQVGHLGIVKGPAKVKFVHLIFSREHVAVLPVGGHIFPDPLVEIP